MQTGLIAFWQAFEQVDAGERARPQLRILNYFGHTGSSRSAA